MATETPWADPEFERRLEQKIGSDWVRQLETKWGPEWAEPSARELADRLGDSWADYPDQATDALAELVTVEPAADVSEQKVDFDFGRYEWLSTLLEVDSFESWLVRVGVSEQDARELAEAERFES